MREGVFDWLGWIKKTVMLPEVQVHTERCPAVRSPSFFCSRCLDVCPRNAIRLEGQHLEVNEANCDGCGLCEAACPNGVFATIALSEEWIVSECRREAEQGKVAIRCNQAKSKGKTRGVVEVSCLGRLAWEIIAGLAIGGVEADYLCGDCQLCVMKEGGALWRTNQATARTVLRTLGWERDTCRAVPQEGSSLIEGYVADGLKISRRGLLSGAFKLTLASVSGNKDEDRQPGESRGPTKRRRWFLRVLKDRLAASGSAFPAERSFPWPTLHENGPCFFCGACATLCPVGALEFDRKTLRFLTSFCTQCGLCQTVCPYKSLEFSQQTPVSDFLTVVAKTLAVANRNTCSWCGVEFDASGNPAKCGSCTLLESMGLLVNRNKSEPS